MEYSLSIDEHGINLNGSPIQPRDTIQFATISTRPTRHGDLKTAIDSFANAHVTAEVTVRIVENSQASAHKELVVSTQIIDVFGSRISAEVVERRFPLRSHRPWCTSLACSVRHVIDQNRRGRGRVGKPQGHAHIRESRISNGRYAHMGPHNGQRQASHSWFCVFGKYIGTFAYWGFVLIHILVAIEVIFRKLKIQDEAN